MAGFSVWLWLISVWIARADAASLATAPHTVQSLLAGRPKVQS
jgi:hypothetical protein